MPFKVSDDHFSAPPRGPTTLAAAFAAGNRCYLCSAPRPPSLALILAEWLIESVVLIAIGVGVGFAARGAAPIVSGTCGGLSAVGALILLRFAWRRLRARRAAQPWVCPEHLAPLVGAQQSVPRGDVH